jgi:hypothetical protein
MRYRSLSSPEIGTVRGEIYRYTYKRARRAIKAGFYLEAIALTEFMMADRIESILSHLQDTPAQFRTVNQAVGDLLKRPEYLDSELLHQIRSWSHGRSRWIHEFAKVSDQDHLTWRKGLKDARRVAEDGLELLTKITEEAKRRRRRQRH